MLNLYVSYATINRLPSTFQSGQSDHVIKCSQLCLRTPLLDCHVFPYLLFVSSYKGLQLCSALHWSTPSKTALNSNYEECEQQIYFSYDGKETSAEEADLDVPYFRNDDAERERRRKIGLANKGREPWNRGKKHSAETRELIRRRTREALDDPQVRKKMSDCRRNLSNQTKAKIGTAIKRRWQERLKDKKPAEEFILSWSESIAEAAKKGGHGQEQLDWDTYDKIKEEIALEQLEWAAEKAQAKEVALTKAYSLIKSKAEKVKRLALSKQKARLKRLAKKKTPIKLKEDKEKLAVSQDGNLKGTTTEIQQMVSQLNQDHRAWEKVDLEFMKREQTRKGISLADQIQYVKAKKAELRQL